MKQGAFDIAKRVEVTATAKHPTRKDGEVHKIGVVLADDFRKKGFVK